MKSLLNLQRLVDIFAVPVRLSLYVKTLEDFIDYSSDFVTIVPRILYDKGGFEVAQIVYSSIPNDNSYSVVRHIKPYFVRDYAHSSHTTITLELERLALDAKRKLEIFGKEIVICNTQIVRI